MVVDLKLVKEENQPFGFRLIGGTDFATPLTVSRVSVWMNIKSNVIKCHQFISEILSSPIKSNGNFNEKKIL